MGDESTRGDGEGGLTVSIGQGFLGMGVRRECWRFWGRGTHRVVRIGNNAGIKRLAGPGSNAMDSESLVGFLGGYWSGCVNGH